MFKNIVYWILANAFLPIISPVLFGAGIKWLDNRTFPFVELFFNLIDNGFYIFSAASLIFSLYEEYDICKRCISLIMQTILVLLLLIASGMFYIIYNKNEDYVSQHHMQFYLIWFLTALCACFVKYSILKYKKRMYGNGTRYC